MINLDYVNNSIGASDQMQKKPARSALPIRKTGSNTGHICAQLLDAGYRVRVLLRTLDHADEFHDAVFALVSDKSLIGKYLSFAEFDHDGKDGWRKSATEEVIPIQTHLHTPIAHPIDEKTIIYTPEETN